MPTITEDDLGFEFPADWHVSKYDAWAFYRNRFQSSFGGARAVDIVARSPDRTTWLIEIKDYRRHRRGKIIELPDEIACKVRDTLAGLVAARCNANDTGERDQAHHALSGQQIRVILHLEQPARHSKLFPRSIDPADVQQKLKQLIRAVDPHPKVVARGDKTVAWQVRSM